MKLFFNALILIVIFFIPSAWTITKTEQPSQTYASMPEAILFYVNQYRIKRGLNPLKMNRLMSQEAKKHSEDMATHKMGFGHQDFDRRISRLYDAIKGCRGGAENVAYAYKGAQDVVKNWLTSSGHRQNILGHYHLTGIGVARDGRGKLYYTQIFLKTDHYA